MTSRYCELRIAYGYLCLPLGHARLLASIPPPRFRLRKSRLMTGATARKFVRARLLRETKVLPLSYVGHKTLRPPVPEGLAVLFEVNRVNRAVLKHRSAVDHPFAGAEGPSISFGRTFWRSIQRDDLSRAIEHNQCTQHRGDDCAVNFVASPSQLGPSRALQHNGARLPPSRDTGVRPEDR